ncbi:hypothetical protein [Pleomorphomonas carboxyditropha]|uniref:Uncharacterized protein n=1 Tax=Pleomorphomonas carboxyditropha TaxID=2023338 RepID=A0A2G9WPP6_9HYPH|nr:hypothetical protein [Pleomorphomonas carboxyditropha]PIO96625.1 hypothetical protein CJ014_24570 [Pleomorphomonas carboxyditropha]
MLRDYSPQEKRSGFWKSIAILFLLSVVGSLALKLHRGDEVGHFRGAQGRWVGELLGEAGIPFFAGLLVFGIVRLRRWADVPKAGLISGIITTLIFCGLLYRADMLFP